MTLSELDSSLPSGFHDSALKSFAVDYEQRKVCMKLSLRVGNPDGPRDHRDDCREAKLEISGAIFFILDAPDKDNDFGSAGEVWIADGFETRSIPKFTNHLEGLLDALPDGAFAHSFYVQDWNSYIHIAARDCSIEWLGDVKSYRGRRQTFYPGETLDR